MPFKRKTSDNKAGYKWEKTLNCQTFWRVHTVAKWQIYIFYKNMKFTELR